MLMARWRDGATRPGRVFGDRWLAGVLLLPVLLAGCASGRPRVSGGPEWATAASGARIASAGLSRATPLDSIARAVLDTAAARYLRAAQERDPAGGQPRWAGSDLRWHTVPLRDWTSGFFPGVLWELYRRSGDDRLRAQADRWMAALPGILDHEVDHDLGFQFLTTYVAGYRLTHAAQDRDVALRAATLLAARFSPRVGAIKSWNNWPPERPYPVIVDNMMNLELLFWGTKNGGDPAWRSIALTHARTTIAHHLRSDGGSFHVVVFDTTGRVVARRTAQGLADSTTWTRGQAWLVYGFTMAYRESGEGFLRDAARRTADYFIARLPADGVPCWDFQAPGCPGPHGAAGANARPPLGDRDVAAGAIAASGLLELSTRTGKDGARYRAAAERILTGLTSAGYMPPAGAEPLLLHATGARPANSEVDVSLIYADYYFVEALERYLALRGL